MKSVGLKKFGMAWAPGRAAAGVVILAGCMVLGGNALAATPPSHGVLVHLNPSQVAAFNQRHNTTATRLNPNRDLYVVVSNGSESDTDLLNEIKTDSAAGRPALNVVIKLDADQSTASVLNEDQSTASVLNAENDDQSTASVLNDDQSTASVLNGWVNYYSSKAPAEYVHQPLVGQIAAGSAAHAIATGRTALVALIDNGVDQFNPVLRPILVRGYNAIDHNHNASAWADLAQSTASVLNSDQSTASVLNAESDDQSTASVLNADQSTASVLNDDQSTASVLNDDQSTASVLNDQSTASVLNCTVPGTHNRLADDQSTASVLNAESDDQSTASVLNTDQSTASVLNADQSTASVLNAESDDQSTASVLNDDQSTASVLNALNKILACNPDFGHGTSVAGLIHLVAPEAHIMPIKAFGADGSADASVVYEAITYAIDHHVDEMNLSFSASATTEDIQDAIQEAVSKGIVVVAAAGNDDVTSAVYPASLSGVIGTGAVDGCNAPTSPAPAPGTVNPCAANPLLRKAAFSNYDPASGVVDVNVSAPGVQLFTTYPGFGRIWATVSGTSFSTPLVAGEAALLTQLRNAGSASAIDGSTNTAIAPDAAGHLLGGNGMIQVLGALKQNQHGHGNH